MLSNLTDGDLLIGMGRGTAKMEYDAFNVNMEHARGRLRETLDILRLGLTGDEFDYEGEHFYWSHDPYSSNPPAGQNSSVRRHREPRKRTADWRDGGGAAQYLPVPLPHP